MKDQSAASTGSELTPLRDTAWLARYLDKSEKYVRANAATYGGMRVGKAWRFDDAGIAAGLESLRPVVTEKVDLQPVPAISTASMRRFARHRFSA